MPCTALQLRRSITEGFGLMKRIGRNVRSFFISASDRIVLAASTRQVKRVRRGSRYLPAGVFFLSMSGNIFYAHANGKFSKIVGDDKDEINAALKTD